jgi:hypothetical protein
LHRPRLGGIDLLLVQTYGAAAVHAVDTEQGVLGRARGYAQAAGIGCITHQRISRRWEHTGEIARPADSVTAAAPAGGYDVVFSKVCVEDLCSSFLDKPQRAWE